MLVVVLLVEPDTPPVLLSVEPVPVLPIELVLPLVPAALPVDGLVLEGPGLVEGVVEEELVEPDGPVVPSRLLQALSERAATTARVATAH